MRQGFRTRYGHFSADGREYVITRPDTPRPWVNVICPGDYGTIVSQAGGGYSWMTHATFNRLTRWEQDLVRDEWGKWIYCRDRDSGRHWSLGWQPVKARKGRYECRHGIGYTTIVARHEGIESEYTLFVPPGEPLELWRVRLTNHSARAAAAGPLQLPRVEPRPGTRHPPRVPQALHRDRVRRAGPRPAGRQAAQHHRRARAGPALERGVAPRGLPRRQPAAGGARVRQGGLPRTVRLDRRPRRPAPAPPLEAPPASGWTRSARSRSPSTLAPGESREVVFTLGLADDRAGALRLARRYQRPGAVEAAWRRMRRFWDRQFAPLEVKTPDPAFDLLTNTWLKYQTLSSRVWGRTGYFQPGGAFGYRDQLQDSQVFLPLDPRRTRAADPAARRAPVPRRHDLALVAPAHRRGREEALQRRPAVAAVRDAQLPARDRGLRGAARARPLPRPGRQALARARHALRALPARHRHASGRGCRRAACPSWAPATGTTASRPSA